MVSQAQVGLKQLIAERPTGAAEFRMVWAVTNLGRDPLQLRAVRFPHQEFKSEERRFEPPIDLAGGGEVEFEALVRTLR